MKFQAKFSQIKNGLQDWGKHARLKAEKSTSHLETAALEHYCLAVFTWFAAGN
jgi:hypothetical protein